MKKTILLLVSFFVLASTVNAASTDSSSDRSSVTCSTPPTVDIITYSAATQKIIKGINAFLDSGELGDCFTGLDKGQINSIRYMIDLDVFESFGRADSLATLNRSFLKDEEVDIDEFGTSILEHMRILNGHIGRISELVNLSQETFVTECRAFFVGKLPAKADPRGRLAFALAMVALHERFYDAF